MSSNMRRVKSTCDTEKNLLKINICGKCLKAFIKRMDHTRKVRIYMREKRRPHETIRYTNNPETTKGPT